MEEARIDKARVSPRGELEAGVGGAPMPVLLAVADAAAFLGLSVKTLANWRVSGAGPQFIKLGSRVLYNRIDLEAFLAENTVSSTSQRAGVSLKAATSLASCRK